MQVRDWRIEYAPSRQFLFDLSLKRVYSHFIIRSSLPVAAGSPTGSRRARWFRECLVTLADVEGR
jgi:hypothetical protein